MGERKGEKLGWIGGWLGAFSWVLVLGIVLLAQGRTEKGIIGIALFALGVFFAFAFAPWRHPDTAYYELMLPLYFLFFAAAGWAIWGFRGWRAAGGNWWTVIVIVPMLMPLFNAGKRTWNDTLAKDKRGN
ncbi:MAG: hypothetical protein PHX05_08780 [Acidobacteriota bacterium]|nr:hypothetical protein [Acidobacteriota bacterium]